MKERCLLILGRIRGEDVKDELERVEDELFSLFVPQKYDGQKGLEVKHIKGFNETCVIMQQHMVKDPRKMMTLEYFQALDLLKQQFKNKRKAQKKR